jgi:hypothetical protein
MPRTGCHSRRIRIAGNGIDEPLDEDPVAAGICLDNDPGGIKSVGEWELGRTDVTGGIAGDKLDRGNDR